MSSDVENKQPVYLFRQECKTCAYLDSNETKYHPCHYTKRSKKTGQLNDDCPAAEMYFVIGFKPEAMAEKYVRATTAGDNRKIIAIVAQVSKQHENLQGEFWAHAQLKTALLLGAQEEDAENENQGESETAGEAGQPEEANGEYVDPLEGAETVVGAATAVSNVVPIDPGIDTNDWSEEE